MDRLCLLPYVSSGRMQTDWWTELTYLSWPQASHESEMVRAHPLTWRILKIVHFSALHHISTKNNKVQTSLVVQ
jgi:hypothetical protein